MINWNKVRKLYKTLIKCRILHIKIINIQPKIYLLMKFNFNKMINSKKTNFNWMNNYNIMNSYKIKINKINFSRLYFNQIKVVYFNFFCNISKLKLHIFSDLFIKIFRKH